MIGKWWGVYIGAQPKKSNVMKAAVDALGVLGFLWATFLWRFPIKDEMLSSKWRHVTNPVPQEQLKQFTWSQWPLRIAMVAHRFSDC